MVAMIEIDGLSGRPRQVTYALRLDAAPIIVDGLELEEYRLMHLELK